jgi:galactose oxidase
LSHAPTVAVGGLLSAKTDSSCIFVIMRLGVNTHTINNDHRRVPLVVKSNTNNEYSLRVPNNPRVALPGLYWLFAIDVNGVPSVGGTVLVTVT